VLRVAAPSLYVHRKEKVINFEALLIVMTPLDPVVIIFSEEFGFFCPSYGQNDQVFVESTTDLVLCDVTNRRFTTTACFWMMTVRTDKEREQKDPSNKLFYSTSRKSLEFTSSPSSSERGIFKQ
jgi:hypothetical protein